MFSFAGFLKISAPGDGALADYLSAPGVRVWHFRRCLGGWPGLALTDTLHFKKNVEKLLRHFEYSKSPKAKTLSVLRIGSEGRPKFPAWKKCIHSIYSSTVKIRIR